MDNQRNSSTKALRDACEAAISKALFECGEELRAEGAKFGTATALLEEVARRVAHGPTVAVLLDVAEAAQEFGDAFADLCEHYAEQDPLSKQIETWEAASRTQCALADAINHLNHLLPQGEPE